MFVFYNTIWISRKVYICGILFSVINTMITIVSLMSLIPECFWPDINRNKKYNSSVFCSLHNKSESNKVRQNVWKWMVEKEVLLFWAALSICLKLDFYRVMKQIKKHLNKNSIHCQLTEILLLLISNYSDSSSNCLFL